MFEQFIGTKAVEERHRIDQAALERFLGFSLRKIEQFKGGQSNPTYLLQTPARRYVLRRKPPGKLLPSAHAVDREFRVISALHGQGFPVAAPVLYCDDAGIAGTAFYVLDHLDVDPAEIEADPAAGTVARTYAAYEAEIATLGKELIDELYEKYLDRSKTKSIWTVLVDP